MTAEKSPPFSWQDKRVLRRIREQVQDYASGIAVYVALAVVASDTMLEEFQTTHAWLAQLSGLGERTVRSRLHDLQEIGVIQIVTPKLRAPCTYRLLPFGNGDRAHGNGCRTFGKVFALPLPGSEVMNLRSSKGSASIAERGPLTTPARISLEAKLRELRIKRKELKADTSEPWQRQAYPERMDALRAVEAEIADIDRRLA